MKTSKLILAALVAAILMIVCPMAFATNSDENTQSVTFDVSFLDLSGIMTVQDQKVSDYSVYIFQDGAPMDTFQVNTKLEQHYMLPIGHNYALKYTKAGYKDRILLVNTYIDSKQKADVYTFRYSIEFIADGESNTFDDFPVAMITYNVKEKDFDYNREYHNNVRTDIRPSETQTASKSWH